MKALYKILICSAFAFAMLSCRKAKNLEPVPSMSLISTNIKVLETNKEYNNLRYIPTRVPYETDVELTFKVSSPAGFEQIDFKFYGEGSVWSGGRPDSLVNGSGRKFILQNVPYDWVNLNTIKGGFDSNYETILKFKLKSIKQNTKFSFVIIDKNLNRSAYDYEIKTTELGFKFNKEASDVVLYSQNATLNDVSNVEGKKKMFFNVFNLSASDTTAISNGSVLDFFFVNTFKEIKDPITNQFLRDSVNIPSIYSTNILIDVLKKDTLRSLIRGIGILPSDTIYYKIRGLDAFGNVLKPTASGSISIKKASFDFDGSSLGDLLFEDMSLATNKIDIEVDSTYILTASNIFRAIIKVKSIENSVDGGANAKLVFDIKAIHFKE